jgi:hypothetical protein
MVATICLPKHYICSTFVPDFTPGPEKTVLQSFTESRGRLAKGNSFFRSIGVGTGENSTTVEAEWLENIGGSVYVPTLFASNTARARITISDGSAIETFSANQTFGVSSWATDARASLASQVNACSAFIQMNITDVQQPWPVAVSNFQDKFETTNLAGAGGPPSTTPSSTIRTGPIHSFVLVTFSEANSPVGTLVEISEMREWRNVIGGSPTEFDWGVRLDPVSGSTCFDPETVDSDFCDTGL